MNRLIKRSIIFILILIFFLLVLIFNRNQSPNISMIPKSLPEAQLVKVLYVIDGDTIIIDGNKKVRYIGINAPEFIRDATGKKTDEECFAEKAYLENKELVEGKTVRIEKDTSETDKYGRLLRYVYINGVFINNYLVKNGFAKIMTIKPDIKFSQLFETSEKTARETSLGLWRNCLPPLSSRQISP